MKLAMSAQWMLLSGLMFLMLIVYGCGSFLNQEAAQEFQNRRQLKTVTVYPVNIIMGYGFAHDPFLARKLANYLDQEELAATVAGSTNHYYPFKWGHNQAKMARRSAITFSQQVKTDKITTDYALLIEILTNGDETAVLGVEYYLCDSSGRIADASLRNSDWEDFRKVNPRDRNGGLEVAKLMLKENWKKR